MRFQQKVSLFLLLGAILVQNTEARRVQPQPVQEDPEQEEETIQYYSAAEPQERTQQQVVYVTAEQYNGLYGQQAANPRSSQRENLLQSVRAAQSKISKAKEPSNKAPPVQTIRNYNKVNDDGSFTFGYEAADGSFKEETRGTDCVVRGKYGYIDPDGNKREFTYVSGNPCDPNAPKEEEPEESEEEDKSEPDNGPANYPTKPIRPLRPSAIPQKPAVTFFQNNFEQEDVQPEPEQLLKPQPVQPIRARPQYLARPTLLQQTETEEQPIIYQRPRLFQPTTPASLIYKQSVSPVSITPRPVTSSPTTVQQPELPATTYRPLLQVAITPRPSLLYTKQISATPRPPILPSTYSPPVTSTRDNIDFDAEFQKFQQENNLLSPTPPSIAKSTPRIPKPPSPAGAPGQIYSSQLVFDPSTGQYNTQLFQNLPQTPGQFSLNHRIQPYVHQPQHPQQHLVNLQQLQQQNQLYRNLKPQASQASYQAQQAELQFQNSAQLFAQQQQHQRARTIQPAAPQQFYYVQPASAQHPQALVGGQIDAFLRGHNIQF